MKDVLTVDEGFCGCKFENCDIDYVFNYCEKTDRVMDKRIAPLDSGDRIGVEIILNGILTGVGKCSPGSCHIGRVILISTGHHDKLDCNSCNGL